MTNPWKPTNNMTDDTVLFDAIGKIRESSDKRREIEARVLAENNLASVRQLSHDKAQKFCAIVDAILAEEADVNTQLFPEDDQNLIAAASQMKTTAWGTITEAWTKQDNNPEKNSTFLGAPKKNPNKGGYAGGAKPEKTKGGYTAMKRIKEDGEGDLQEISTQKAQQVYQKTGAALKKAQAAGDTETARKREKGNFMAYKRGTGAPIGKRPFGEDLEEMYLDIENFVLESEGLDSIDRLNEQGQEKLAAVVEAVMEEILAEESDDLQELSPQLLRRAADTANRKGNMLAHTKGHKDPEVRARWGQSMKMSHAAASKESAATSKSIPSFRNLKDRLGKGEKIRPKFEETMEEGVLATGAAAALGVWGASKINKMLKGRGTKSSSPPRLTVSDKEAAASVKNSKAKPLLKSGADNKIVARQGRDNVEYRKSMKGEEIVAEGWFSGSAKKSPTPNPKGAPRGERDVGDYKNPSGQSNKSVSQAVRNDRKAAKKNGGRLSGEGY